MTTKIKTIIILGIIALIAVVVVQQRHLQNTKAKMVRFEQNSKAMLSDIERWQVDSTTMAASVNTLRLTINELEKYRSEDANKIEAMGIKIEDLEAVAKHNLEVNAPISVPIRDTIIIRDSIPIVGKTIMMATPHITINATIDSDSLTGSIKLPVTIRQAVWIEYKRKCLFWKKPVAVHQTITSDNPYVKIKYSEYITIQK